MEVKKKHSLRCYQLFYLKVIEMEEIWKQIPNYSDYLASDLGRIKSLKFGKERIMKQGVDGMGYRVVNLSECGTYRTKLVHRLITRTFIGESPLTCDHINGNKKDNRLINLRYLTQRENIIAHHSKQKKSSKYTGVSWRKSIKKWWAYIRVGNKVRHLGYFNSELMAHRANKKALNSILIKNKI